MKPRHLLPLAFLVPVTLLTAATIEQLSVDPQHVLAETRRILAKRL